MDVVEEICVCWSDGPRVDAHSDILSLKAVMSVYVGNCFAQMYLRSLGF